MEQEKQLLASLLSYNEIPFGDYKNYMTTDKAVDLFVQSTPKQELDKMFVSAGLPVPKDEYEASRIFQGIYNKISTVDETSFSGSYRQEKEQEQLDNILASLEDNENPIDVGGDGDMEMPSNGTGFSDILRQIESDLASGQGQGQGDEEEEGEGEDGQGQGDGEEDGDGEDGQGQGQGQGQGEGEEDGDGEDGQGQGDGDGEEDGEGDGEEDQNQQQQNQQNQQQQQQQQQRENDLEREIRLCAEGIDERKVMLSAIESNPNKDASDLIVVEDLNNQIKDLENQIYVMMGALDSSEVLQVNDQQQYLLPLYLNSDVEKKIADLKLEIAKKSNEITNPYLNEVQDKKRRNKIITDVVLTNLKYYTYHKLNNENKLLDLYLTKKDLKEVVVNFGKDKNPRRIILRTNVAGADDLEITDETKINSLVYQLNVIEKNIETLNKQKNIDLIFTEIKNELINKFII